MKRINQKKIAQQLKVSQGVVSAVLSGNPAIRVGKEKREKILAAIKKSNYQPNRLANALLNRETKTVGVFYQGGYIQLGMRKLSAVVTSLSQKGYLPLVYDLLFDMKGNEQCQLLCDLNVKGAIFINISESFMYETYPQFLKGKLDIASIDSPWDPSIHQFYSDRVQGFSILADHLIRKGYKKIAIIMSSPHPQTRDSPYTHGYGLLHGVTDTLKEAGLKPVGIEIYDSDHAGSISWSDPYLAGRISLKKLLDGGCRPDAVICSNDAWAIGALQECFQRGLRVPDDIAIAGFNDDVQSKYSIPPLTTVAPPVEELADAAVQYIIGSKSEKKRLHREQAITSLQCRLVIRDSCGGSSTVVTNKSRLWK